MLLVAVVLTLGLPAPVSAHAYLERTNPADGSSLDRAPARLALSFSEHVVLEATRIELVDSAGVVTALTSLALETDDVEDTEVPSVVTASLPDLPRDAYRVRWSTLSSDDLHRTSGFFVFGVGTSVRASGFHEPAPGALESGLRWVLLLGLALTLGSLLVGRLVSDLPDDRATASARERTQARLRRAGVTGAAVAVLVAVALLIDQSRTAGLPAADLMWSGYGARWAVRELGLLLLLCGVLFPPRGRGAGRLLLSVGVLTAALGSALLGHAGADPGRAATRVMVTAVHLVAVLGWVGAVGCLAIILVPGVAGPREVLGTRRLLRAFGRPAAACLGVGVATGLYLTSSTVVSIDAAVATTYGRTLLLKLGLVALMAVLALLNHRRLRGPHDLDLPRRTVLLEASVAVLVLAATGVLTSAQPATEPQFQSRPAATDGPIAAVVDDLRLQLDVAPGVAGLNVVSVDVLDTRRPAPGEVTAVSFDVGGGQPVAATPLGDGRWSASGLDLPPGPREVRVEVTRPGLPASAATESWTIGASVPARRTIVSAAPISTLLRSGAGVVGLLVGFLWWRTRSPRRRRRFQEPEPDLGGPDEELGAFVSASADRPFRE